YLVKVNGASKSASQEAAASAAAHEVLVQLYPAFQVMLDFQFQQSLAEIGEGPRKTKGIRIGQDAAEQILALRSNDGSAAHSVPSVFGAAPGDYQSTPTNFPAQPVFTHWPDVMPFALESASQFRPGPPPTLTSSAYADALNEVQVFGVVNGTNSSAEQALTGRF